MICKQSITMKIFIVLSISIFISACFSLKEGADCFSNNECGENKQCVNGACVANVDSDTGADSDTDIDTDSDTDSDSDMDTDTDVDSDADTDTDVDSDIDTDSDSDVDADTDVDSDADTDTDVDSDTDTDSDSDTDSDTDTDTDTGCVLPVDCGEPSSVCYTFDCVGKECRRVHSLDFTQCEISTLPYDYSHDVCLDGECVSPGTCDGGTCNISRPSFPMPPSLGHNDFTRTGGQEPVVIDSVTGLVWQGCTGGTRGEDCCIKDDGVEVDGGAVTDGGAGLDGGPDLEDCEAWRLLTWREALNYCDNLVWAGYDDWYLPDLYSLVSIVSYDTSKPSLPAAYFPNTPYKFDDSHGMLWSSFRWGLEPSFAGALAVAIGTTGGGPKTATCFTRCVRGGDNPAGPRFERTEEVAGEPVVTDHMNKLIWQGCHRGSKGSDCTISVDGFAIDWYSAKAYCDGLTWGDYVGWRLPNNKELQGIVDYRNEYPIGDAVIFPNLEFMIPVLGELSGEVLDYHGYWSVDQRFGNTQHWFLTIGALNNETTQSGVTVGVRCVKAL